MSQIPVTLGKHSLRVRLEAYYSLIDPDRLQDSKKWRQTFDEIYKKYGGTFEGERKLSSKLAKKYGSRVRLLLAEEREKKEERKAVPQFSESWFEVPEESTGVINFCSVEFDPMSLLAATEAKVHERNSCFDGQLIQCLDNTQQFAQYLPIEDPLHFQPQPTLRKRLGSPQVQSSHPFTQIAISLQTGPFAMLRNLIGLRIRVITRYVNSIRGSLTGTLVAFDKHLNLVLLDVEETFTCRPSETGTATNIEVELERRRILSEVGGPAMSSGVKRRRMKQIMLRGDNLVSVYKESHPFEAT